MDKLTLDRAIELTREVVAEHGPDFAYQIPADHSSCRYVHFDDDETPVCGCIVAHVLHRHGVALETLLAYEGWTAWALNNMLRVAEENAADFLRVMQLHQDQGWPWGLALSGALKAAGRD